MKLSFAQGRALQEVGRLTCLADLHPDCLPCGVGEGEADLKDLDRNFYWGARRGIRAHQRCQRHHYRVFCTVLAMTLAGICFFARRLQLSTM